MPHFAYADGWLGGDAVYSVPIPGGESRHATVWIFGDTYVGAAGARDRVGAKLIHNSVAISQCGPDGRFELEYAWRRDERGRPGAIFETSRPRHYVWPFDGFFLDDRLYVLLLELREEAPRGALGLPIQVTRTLLARVENPDDRPAYWRVDTRALTVDGAPMLSLGVLVERDFVHVMATPNVDTGRNPRFLVRVPVRAIEDWPEDLSPSVETFTHRGAWEPGLISANARVLMADNATEMSIDRMGPTGRYFAVYSAPVQTAGDGAPSRSPHLDAHSIFARTAISLTGPWSERRRVHVMTEGVEPLGDEPAGRRICYAGKAHAEHSPAGVLALTYVCNLVPGRSGPFWGVLEAMSTRMDLYRPNVAVHPWPEGEVFRPPETEARR